MNAPGKSRGELKVTVVVNGRFHAFDYAAELHSRGMLGRLISSMPKCVATRFGIPGKYYVGLFHFEVLKRVWRITFKRELPVLFYARHFTKSAAKYVPTNSSAIISFAGYSEEIFTLPLLSGIPKILDRGSTHTLVNQRLKHMAAQYHGTKWEAHPKDFIERELKEYELADAILVPSTFVRHTFLQEGINSNKIWQIPYGISIKRFAGLDHQATQRQEAILFVGNDQVRKGIGVLIDAMKIVRTAHPQMSLWVVGGTNEVLKIFDLATNSWIKSLGALHGQLLLDRYKSAKIFCLPSFEEGLGLVLTEALQCGLPIIATHNTGATDIIEDGKEGFLIPPGNPEALAGRIITLLDDQMLYDKMVANAKLRRNEMTWQRFVDNLVDKLQTTICPTII